MTYHPIDVVRCTRRKPVESSDVTLLWEKKFAAALIKHLQFQLMIDTLLQVQTLDFQETTTHSPRNSILSDSVL